MGQDASSGRPGGGLGTPINTPDPLSNYKWWILGALALLFAGAAFYLLRKQQGQAAPLLNEKPGPHFPVAVPSADVRSAREPVASFGQNGALDFIKEELFAIQSEKIVGALSEEEYEETRRALEIILKRVLNNQ
jgi:hypothetical protein